MLRIAICDDSQECREKLEDYCETYFAGTQSHCLMSYASGEELLKAVEQEKNAIDLVFLDIEMEGINGIEVKEYLERMRDTFILFVTDHDHYMPRAFGYQVIGFLKKPVDYAEFEEKMQELLRLLEPRKRVVWAKDAAGEKKILLRDIDWIEGKGRYVRFCMEKNSGGKTEFIEFHSYGYWKDKLSDCDVREIRKGCLVNFANVAAVESGEIIFDDGRKMGCSVRKRKEIAEYFETYIDKHAR